jgi:hypothetical protein
MEASASLDASANGEAATSVLAGGAACPYPRRVRRSILALLAVFLASGASAQSSGDEPLPPPGGVPDIAGARTLALSAGVGLAAGNDGMYVNPAAIAARRRYSIEAGGYLDRRGAENVAQLFGASVVDSITAPLTAGVSYLRAQGGLFQGNLVHGALAGAIVERLYVGASVKWLSLRGAERVGAATADAGLFWQVANYLSVGAAGYNLIPIGHEAIAPMGFGAGLALGSDQVFQLTGDWRVDLDRGADGSLNRWGAGAELLLGRLVPVRAGWSYDEALDDHHWWSVGVGLVTRNGVAIDVGYRQALDAEDARSIAASIKLFLFD